MSARDKLLQQFRDLVGERVGRISKNLMELEGGPNVEAGKQALRELHGLKGEARMMGFAAVNSLVHEMEELVRVTEKGGYALDGGSADALLVVCDAVKVLAGSQEASGPPPDVEKLLAWLKQCVQAEQQRAGGGAPAEAAAQPVPVPVRATPKNEETGEHVRVPPTAEVTGEHVRVPPAEKAPSSKPGVSEAKPAGTEGKARAGEKVDGTVRIDAQTLEMLTSAVTSLLQIARRRELGSSRRLLLGRELAQGSRIAEELGGEGSALAARLNRAKDTVAEIHREAKLLANEELRDLSQLYEGIQGLRMLPLSLLFEPYPRMVRDLAKELGKEVELLIVGEENRADRSVVEALRDPLLHLVRNAVDHGLEGRTERVAAGKAPRGKLELRASREGEHILIRVQDDGGGMDPVVLRRAAVRKGFMSEAEATALSDQAARELVFLSGFSSKEATTDISGRGVGLDAVKSRMKALGGDVTLESAPGKGTCFELRVPVSLTVAPLLFVEVGDEQLCLTAAHVLAALRVQPDQLREIAGRPSLEVDGVVMPFASIASTLGLGPERAPLPDELVLVISGQGARAAISVDRVLEERVQAILPLKGVLARFPHLAGATVLADGRLAMVLSATHLVQVATGTAAVRHLQASKSVDVKKRRILVADDSPLTRELLSSLLEAVGYDITTACDGSDAFERLSRDAFDMLVSDLEMPKMDGLELTRRVKTHPTLRTLPVVLVTTRGGDSDRRRGMEAGADGYIAKGDLVRQDLVDVVARLLG